MGKTNLSELSAAELKTKSNSLKGFIGLMLLLGFFLLFYVIRAYLNGEELDMAITTIAICTFGGAVSMYPQLKEVQEEMQRRT
ncbi:MAG: hypothetical protein GVY26_12560 [Bacteroidetes bacterium]|jgi:uncharacterized membrane-anchored protein|nr:hypothetical protein [Bacteroidota bacterium]